MKKVKIKPKSKEKQIVKKASLEAIEYCYNITEAILRCDFGFTNEQIEIYKNKLGHYSDYLRDGTLSYCEILDIIRRKQEDDVQGTDKS